MANVRIEVNRKGIVEILRSSGVQADLRGRAQRIASAAGPGNEVRSEVGKNRARAAVITATFEARWNQGRQQTLTRAVGAGR